MTVTPKHHVEVSSRIKREFNNGREYYALHGKEIRVPQVVDRQPSAESLQWHNENVYRP
jgi:putative restriction endonuclease